MTPRERDERRQYLLEEARNRTRMNPRDGSESVWREVSRLDDQDSGASSMPHTGPAHDPRWDAYFSALNYAGGNAPEGADVDVNNWMGPNSESEAYKTTSAGTSHRPRGRGQRFSPSMLGLNDLYR